MSKIVEALRELSRGYMILMENGRDRIKFLGGQCDSLEMMEASDPYLRKARAALAEHDAQPQQEHYPEAAQVCAEAYQVVGSLLSDLGVFDTERAIKILDNLSEHRMVHDDVLPWPSFASPAAQQERPVTVNPLTGDTRFEPEAPQQERTERERFEAWFANQLWHGGSAIENAFRVWQAALAQRNADDAACKVAVKP